MGLDKPLIETPRSASFISAETIDRYGIQTIDDLIAVSPSSYTGSFYGVAGSLNIRGTMAENYFRGFKLIENLGTYGTPVAGAEAIEVVRGPPMPNYGSGKVGGMLNYSPKGGKINGQYPTEVSGQLNATLGSYDKKIAAGQVTIPANIGSIQGGVSVYGEVEDSHSYYRGIHPEHQMIQVGSDFGLGKGWTFSAGGMYFHEDGNVQTPGWNRVTQELIDNGTYQTGRNTFLVDVNGDGRLQPQEMRPGCVYPAACTTRRSYTGAPLTGLAGWYPLTTGVGTAKLDNRTVFNSSADFSRTEVSVLYADLVKDLGAYGEVKLQSFYTKQRNERFVSYGFPADFDASTTEVRASYKFELKGWDDFIVTKNLVGVSNRHYSGTDKESFGSGMIALNRRDLSVGATATDILDSPFTVGDNGFQWEFNLDSTWNDAGVFGLTDITVGDRLNFIFGGRYDYYKADAHNTGVASFETNLPVSGSEGAYTYNASVSYKLPYNLMPYASYSKATSLEVNQAGGLAAAKLQGAGAFLSQGQLHEVGLKFQLLNKTLVGAIDGYKQYREQLAGENRVTQPTIARGVEYEVRWLVTDNFSLSLAGNVQKTKVVGPDTATLYISPTDAGIPASLLAYGAEISVATNVIKGNGDYLYSVVPEHVTSLFATYTSDEASWGKWGVTVGATHAAKVWTLDINPIILPAHTLVNLSGFYSYGPWTASLNIDNALDKRYYVPSVSNYVNVAILPGIGREWRFTLARQF